MATDLQITVHFLIGLIVAISFLLPLMMAISANICVLIGAGLLYFVYIYWETADPNEWMLLIDNGKMVNKGIGLRCFRFPTQQVVKFPSQIQQVEFNANNITKEKQGLELKGFAIWQVYREDEGPFQYYKYSQGADANSTVRTTCESILRSQIANNTLMDVMQKRLEVRDKMVLEIRQQCKGWGIYIESVELTEVRICSNQVFKDLQADFRQITHLDAEKIRQSTNQKLSEIQMTSDQAINETRAMTDMEKDKQITQININKEKIQANFNEQQMKLDEEKKILQQQLDVLKQKCDYEIEQLKVKNKLISQAMQSAFELETAKKWLELDKSHDKKTIQKYYIDQLLTSYSQFPLQEVVLNQFQSKNEGNSLFQILPGINEIYQQNVLEANQ